MNKSSQIISAVAVLSIVLIGGFSAVGLLQSTERVSSSGIIIQPAPPPPPPPPPPSPPPSPPPEPTIEIDVFSDSACTQPMSNVVWGNIEVDSTIFQSIYIRNAGDDGVTLSLSAENWNPVDATNYLQLSWNYDGSTIASGEIREVILSLSAASSVSGIDSFSFDIVITGSAL